MTAEADTGGPAPENTAWQRVQNARHPKRPHTLDYIQRILTDFQEIHGDRLFGDDAAIVCGMARLDGKPVMLVGEGGARGRVGAGVVARPKGGLGGGGEWGVWGRSVRPRAHGVKPTKRRPT